MSAPVENRRSPRCCSVITSERKTARAVQSFRMVKWLWDVCQTNLAFRYRDEVGARALGVIELFCSETQ